MHIPKKAWQKYQNIFNKYNFILQNDGTFIYRFGNEKWMIDIHKLANLVNKDCLEVAMKYSTIQFETTYITAEINHDNDYLFDKYPLFDNHKGYNSRWNKKYELDFKEKMKKTDTWDAIKNQELELENLLGISKTPRDFSFAQENNNDTW